MSNPTPSNGRLDVLTDNAISIAYALYQTKPDNLYKEKDKGDMDTFELVLDAQNTLWTSIAESIANALYPTDDDEYNRNVFLVHARYYSSIHGEPE